jgi:hypothetical protein
MATKIISFEIEGTTSVVQSFEIPENYPVEDISTEELYEEILEMYGQDNECNVLTEGICPYFFEIEEVDFLRFSKITTEIFKGYWG